MTHHGGHAEQELHVHVGVADTRRLDLDVGLAGVEVIQFDVLDGERAPARRRPAALAVLLTLTSLVHMLGLSTNGWQLQKSIDRRPQNDGRVVAPLDTAHRNQL